MWVYAVPLGFFAAFVLKLPVMWVYFLLCTDEFVKWPWVICRWMAEKVSKELGKRVVCTGGFHKDGISEKEIRAVHGSVVRLTEMVIEGLQRQLSNKRLEPAKVIFQKSETFFAQTANF